MLQRLSMLVLLLNVRLNRKCTLFKATEKGRKYTNIGVLPQGVKNTNQMLRDMYAQPGSAFYGTNATDEARKVTDDEGEGCAALKLQLAMEYELALDWVIWGCHIYLSKNMPWPTSRHGLLDQVLSQTILDAFGTGLETDETVQIGEGDTAIEPCLMQRIRNEVCQRRWCGRCGWAAGVVTDGGTCRQEKLPETKAASLGL
ncbi:hypothetical protein BKA62DRAFT_760678 [Auriculariales sp. MPI-PUGE-AT-0066]|nr:hypothetical protein BKA62DRAFT_760678 [Auriculariales sp. MPI-PUGE-AT-0066]